jgi:hypothetical protein
MTMRYVDSFGIVKESFVGLIHVKETTSLFAEYNLRFKEVRGHGYDGTSNLRVEFNGFKSLILRQTSTTYYDHFFSHQRQLVVLWW